METDSTETTMTAQKAVAAATAALTTAESELANLRSEQGAMRRLLESATETGDSMRLIQICKRRDELPSLLFAAELTARQAKVTLLTRQIEFQHQQRMLAEETLGTRLDQIHSECAGLKQQIFKLEMEAAQLSGAHHSQQIRAGELDVQRDRAQRELNLMIERATSVRTAPPSVIAGSRPMNQ